MVFSSAIFVFFFLPITLIGYFLMHHKGKNIWLLAMSLFFYFWGGGYSLFPIIIYSILLNYISGILLEYFDKRYLYRIRKTTFWISIFLNLMMLGYWKYAVFLLQSVKNLTGWQIVIPEIILPIGISFFTFQGMSYVIDVYRKEAPAQRSLQKLGLYISLFPQLVAGPIVRYTDIRNQLTSRNHNVEKFASGIRLFAIGLAKKTIIANSVAVVADDIFGLRPWQNTPSVAWLGLICYVFQIYFDFSGYSDMAVGLGKMFGFQFPQNFNYPYISQSVTEFWRRWHISLSSWFRDYVYIPLGGSRKGNVYLNLFVIFLLTGIWHGASWNFVLWGVYHGIFIVIERYMSKHLGKRIKIPGLICWVYTMFIWSMSMVLFRTETLENCILYMRSLYGMISVRDVGFTLSYYIHSYEIFIFIVSLIAMLPLGKKFYVFLRKSWPEVLITVMADIIALGLIGLSILYIVTGTYNPFIYFQF